MMQLFLGALVASGALQSGRPVRPIAMARMSPPRAVSMVALGSRPTSAPSRPEDAWVASVDLDAFQRDVMALGRKLKAGQGEDDIAHLRKVINWSNMCGAVGILSLVFPLNPVTVIALSTWQFSRWTMIAHHTCHGGYNGQDERFNSRVFATGGLGARVRDWFDWMLPEAWNVEHNNLHHYRLGELEDPDLVERNLDTLRQMPLPMPLKRVGVAFIAGVWKWFYYAPNTFKQLKLAEARKAGDPLTGVDVHGAQTLNLFLPGFNKEVPAQVSGVEFMTRVMLPYLVGHFLLLPLPFVAAGAALGLPAATLFGNALVNLFVADVVSNMHSFIVIATNHAGDDLYRFEKGPARVNSGTWYMRSVVSSANFRTGGDANDFLHGWLNYQIEHHVWPNLSMLSYQRAAPELKALCERHGVPYVQENVFARLDQLTNIMIGQTSMRVYQPDWEKADDFVDAPARVDRAEEFVSVPARA